MHKWGRVRYGQSRKFKPMATPKNAGPEINAEVSEYFAGLAKVRAHSGEPPKVTHIVKQVLAKAGTNGGKIGGLASGALKRAASKKAIGIRWKRYFAAKGIRWVPPSERGMNGR